MVIATFRNDPGTVGFELIAGHAALDFVNTLDDRFHPGSQLERLRDYGDLLRFAEQAHLLDAAQARHLTRSVSPGTAVRALRGARELREALAGILYAAVDGGVPRSEDLAKLERHVQAADRHRELCWQTTHGATPRLAWHRGHYQKGAELPVWLLAQVASTLMLSGPLDRVRACGAQTCRWLFLDTSKNHTRRWCDMKVCGNRMKARRFQARHAD